MILRTFRFILIFSALELYALAPTNLFEPYDILLMTPMRCNALFDFDFTYEGVVRKHAFQGVDQAGLTHAKKRDNLLALWQDQQGVIGVFGNTMPSRLHEPTDRFSQPKDAEYEPLFPNIDAVLKDFELRDLGAVTYAQVKADISIPLNFMFATRFAFFTDFTLGLYLPLYVMRTQNIQWNLVTPEGSPITTDEFVKLLEKAGNMNIHDDWQRQGIGDFTALLMWFHSFEQTKRWLKTVTLGLRGGVIFPTGLAGNPDLLFALPFGDDGGTGIIFGGTLDLDIMHWVHLGLDAQFKHFFGSQRERRIKTAIDQTDLLFLQKAMTFKEPGFNQHYTLYLRWPELLKIFTVTCAYQHTKQQEGRLYVNMSNYNVNVINSAESLQEWSTHSLIGMLTISAQAFECYQYVPAVTIFAKYGFHGHRALLFDTVGVQLDLEF